MEKLLYEEPEALEALGIGKTLLLKLVSAGDVKAVRLGRRKLYPVASLRGYVDRLAAEQADQAR